MDVGRRDMIMECPNVMLTWNFNEIRIFVRTEVCCYSISTHLQTELEP